MSALMVCSDCAMMIANSETGMGEDADQTHGELMATQDHPGFLVLTCDGEDDHDNFSKWQCDGCGSNLAGGRCPAEYLNL